MRTHALTCGMCSVEALALHRGVGDEAQVNLVTRGDQGLRKLVPTEPSQNGRLVRVAVEGLQVIIRAFLVLLDLELVERLQKTRRRGEENETSASHQSASCWKSGGKPSDRFPPSWPDILRISLHAHSLPLNAPISIHVRKTQADVSPLGLRLRCVHDSLSSIQLQINVLNGPKTKKSISGDEYELRILRDF